jgi:glutamyl-tRNA reductase
MKIIVAGINHKTAPIDVRERFAVPESRLPEILRDLQQPGVAEALVLSTCNRFELLLHSEDGFNVRNFIAEYFHAGTARDHVYVHEGDNAVEHIFRVASSLDSMVVGEPQILGQVKEAYAAARAAGTVHSELNALMARSFAVAKRVRTETQIGSSSVSVASVAV